MNFFQLHPPGWPAWKQRICCCHCFDTRHSSSSLELQEQCQWCLIFHAFISPPSRLPRGPVPACQGGHNFSRGGRSARGGSRGGLRPQRRPQLRSPCELAEPSLLRLWQLAGPAIGSVIWTTNLSGQNRNLKVDAPVDRLRLPSWWCPRSRLEQGWCCLGRGCALMMLTSRISNRKSSHCVLWINWFELIVLRLLTWRASLIFS